MNFTILLCTDAPLQKLIITDLQRRFSIFCVQNLGYIIIRFDCAMA